MGKECFKSGIP